MSTTAPRLLGGRYEVGEVIGRGGMAEVHLGHDTRLGRSVAIKLLRSDLARDPSVQARFKREAQSAASLNHPAVVAVYDSGEEAAEDGVGVNAPYIVMEHVQGRTLRDLLQDGPLPWTDALRMTAGVLTALAYSHRAGIVHRDIKPANVMLTPSGDVKVMDFGIARAIADSSATMTQTQAVIGTAQYLSPEQALGETVDARSDLYSTGCLLYQLVTGRPPFVADSPVAVAYQHVGQPPQPPSTHNPTVPHPVDAIVVHALVKDRDGRYQDADEFRADVEGRHGGSRHQRGRPGQHVGAERWPPWGCQQQWSGAHRSHRSGGGRYRSGRRHPGDPGAAPVAAGPVVGEPVPSGATQLFPVPAAGYERTGVRAAEPVLPARARDPERENRTGMWVLLGLLAAALLAVGVLVLPSLIGEDPAATPTVQVANVVGQLEAQATAALKAQNLNVTRVEATSAEVAEGRVVQTSPVDGTTVREGSTVTITVSTGPGTVLVPDLVGQTQKDAERLLAAEGLKLGKVTKVDSIEQATGRVISTEPSTANAVAPGSAVALQVASGRVKVPNVLGLDLAAATRDLTAAKLKVSGTTYRESTQPAGTVIRQTSFGKTVKIGTTIKLVVAKRPAPVVTPTPTPTPTLTPTVTASPTASPPRPRPRCRPPIRAPIQAPSRPSCRRTPPRPEGRHNQPADRRPD
jgi:serine/threonine-protein kinase